MLPNPNQSARNRMRENSLGVPGIFDLRLSGHFCLGVRAVFGSGVWKVFDSRLWGSRPANPDLKAFF